MSTAARAAWWLGVAGGVAALAYDPSATAAAPKRVLILGVALVGLLLPGRSPRRLPAAAAAWLAFVAWMGCSLRWGSPAGLPDLMTWAASLVLLVAALGQPAEAMASAARRAAVVLGGGASVIAIIQWAEGARGSWLHGGQGNPDWLGLVIATALPCSLDWTRKGPRLRRLVIAAEIAGLVCARSRTAWIAALIVCAIGERARLGRLVERRRALACVVVCSLVAAVGMRTYAGGRAALVGRMWIWRGAALVAVRHLPHGTGLGAFGAAFADAQGEALRQLAPDQAERRFVLTSSAHDDWLQAIAEGGIAALGLLAAVILLGVRAHARWPAGAATLATIGIAALADTPVRQPGVLVLLVLVLGAIPSPPTSRGLPLAAPVLVCALCLAIATPAWLAERLLSRSRQEAPLARATTLLAAVRLDPRSPDLRFEAGISSLERRDARVAVGHLMLARQSSWQVATDLALGNAWLSLGEVALAEDSYRHALWRAPGSVRARVSLAEALRRLGRTDEGRVHLEVVGRQRPSSPAVRELRDRFELASGPLEAVGQAGEDDAERAHGGAVDGL